MSWCFLYPQLRTRPTWLAQVLSKFTSQVNRFSQTYLLCLELLLLCKDSLVDVVVLLANATESTADLLVLLVTKLPGWDHIVGLKESVAGNEAVLSTPIIISKENAFG